MTPDEHVDALHRYAEACRAYERATLPEEQGIALAAAMAPFLLLVQEHTRLNRRIAYLVAKFTEKEESHV